jgi:hypothetical protein
MLSRISLLLLATCIAMPATFAGASAESIVTPRKKFNFSNRSFDSNDGFWSQRQRRQQRTRRNTRSFDFFNRGRGFFTSAGDENDFDQQVRQRQQKRVRVSDMTMAPMPPLPASSTTPTRQMPWRASSRQTFSNPGRKVRCSPRLPAPRSMCPTSLT